MENPSEKVCRLCLNVISDGNFKLLEQTTLHAFLNLSVEEDIKPVVCTACSNKLLEARLFKRTCLDTDDNISSYVSSENKTPVDLREIYRKAKGQQHLKTLMNDEQICRLCMHIVTSEFTSVQDVELDMIQTCIPEINFSSTKEPIICAPCLDSLNVYSSFLKSCFKVKKQIKSFNNYGDSPLSIKVEEVEIKSEENDEHSDEYKRYAEYVSETTSHLRHENVSKIRLYECDTCNFKPKHKDNLARHKLMHRSPSELQMYNCSSCDYKTKYKTNLSEHQLTQVRSSEVQMYTCDTCDYKTKQKHHLVRHQLKHKQISNVRLYECDACNFKTKHKDNLKTHRLKHKSPSEVRMYGCSMCHYKTKYKHSLSSHQLTHKDFSEVQIYTCDTCRFQTIRKASLKVHLLRHKNISDRNV